MEPLAGSTFFDKFFEAKGEGLQEVFIHPKVASGVLVQIAQPGRSGPIEGWGSGVTLDELLAGRGLHGNGVASP